MRPFVKEKQMILTYKIKHGKDFSVELAKARQVAEFAVKTKSRSSADVKQFGLKSMISNQVLKKYGDKKVKKVSRVNLIVPNQGVQLKDKKIRIPCLSLELEHQIPVWFSKINQVEINKEYAFVSVTVTEEKEIKAENWIGVDLNATGHCAVASCSSTGKVMKLGKKAYHTHKKYKNARKRLQTMQKLKMVKNIKNRESRIV